MSVKNEQDASLRLEIVEQSASDVTAPVQVIDGVPDGGVVAWLQVLGGFFVFIDTWGIVNSYGAFQTIYEDTLPYPLSNLAWIGSIQGFLLLLVGYLSGLLYDRGYFHALVIPGAFLTFFGVLMTSFGTKYYQLFLAQGVCMGIGTGLIYIPCIAILASYFHQRRALAIGIAAAGSGSGSVIFPTILLQLQPKVGIAWATRAIALIILVTLLLMLSIVRRRIVPIERRKLLDRTAFRDWPYLLFTAGLTLDFMGSYVVFFYVSPYTLARSSASTTLARYMVPILNAASLPGRIFPTIIADHIGCLNTMVPCVFICAILLLSWIAIQGLGGLIAFVLLYGFFTGAFVSITNAAIVTLTDDVKIVGTRLGMSFMCAGFGLLIGNPVGGTLIDLQTGSFVRMQVFGGVLLMTSASLFLASRIAKVGWTPMARI